MAVFEYKAKDNKGKLITGSMEADNRTVVLNRLQATGLYPVSIQMDASAKKAAAGLRFQAKPKLAEIVAINRQLADMIGAGIPLVRALHIIGEQAESEQLRVMLVEVSNDVQGGSTFADALAKHRNVFSKLFTAMVQAGEAGGMLDDVLRRLADYTEMEQELKGQIKAALAYPIVMVFAGIGAIIVLMTVVIPKIIVIFTELGQTLPLPTTILIAVSGFLVGYWWLLLGLGFAAVVTVNRFAKTTEGKLFLHSMVLRMPLVGNIILKREISRFARTFGSLLKNGVPILTALDITRDVLTNVIVANEVGQMPEHIRQGEGVAAPLRNSTVFPQIVVNMIAVGEETAKLDEVLLKVADSFEQQAERELKTFTSLLEPMIILAMGLVVGFIVISILLPIFSIDPGGV